MALRTIDLGAGLLVLLAAAGFVAGYVALCVDEPEGAKAARWARLAGETAVVGALWYWFLMRLFTGGGRMMPYPFSRQSVGIILFAGVICAIGLWPFAAWRAEKDLALAFWRASETTNRMCGAVLGVFCVASLLWQAWQLR